MQRLIADAQSGGQFTNADCIGAGDHIQNAVVNTRQPARLEKALGLHRQAAETEMQQLEAIVQWV